MDRQFSRIVAFFHADKRQIFICFRSVSIARFQSGGGFSVAAATERCWSSLGELSATWPKRWSSDYIGDRLAVRSMPDFSVGHNCTVFEWQTYRRAHISNASRRAVHTVYIQKLVNAKDLENARESIYTIWWVPLQVTVGRIFQRRYGSACNRKTRLYGIILLNQ